MRNYKILYKKAMHALENIMRALLFFMIGLLIILIERMITDKIHQ